MRVSRYSHHHLLTRFSLFDKNSETLYCRHLMLSIYRIILLKSQIMQLYQYIKALLECVELTGLSFLSTQLNCTDM